MMNSEDVVKKVQAMDEMDSAMKKARAEADEAAKVGDEIVVDMDTFTHLVANRWVE